MLENWLHPVALEANAVEHLAPHQWGKNIQIHTEVLPDLRDTRMALIGMREEEADAVRQALYQMSFPFANLSIADLGNARKLNNAFIIPLLKELLESQIIPVLISPMQEHILALYEAFQSLQSHVNYTAVDAQIRLDEAHKSSDAYYLNDMVFNTRSRLFHLSVVGCQTHYTAPAAFQFLERNNFDCIRLGNARADVAEVEPVVRDADLVTLHLAALKQSDAPGQNAPTPSGFTVEEACQISRYAGMSDKLRAFGIFGFEQALDRDAQTAQVVAQLIWYFAEGIYNRKSDFPVSNDGLTEYIVEFKSMEYQLTFWKSQRSGRWWMQVPIKIGKKYNRHKLIPCSYKDYQLACQDELPERLLNAYKRFL